MNKILATIGLIESHVNRVAKGTGKPYSATVLHYEVNGLQKEKVVLDQTMRDHIVNNFHSGDVVIISMEKNEKGYETIVGLQKDDGSLPVNTQQTTTHTTTNTSRYSDSGVGMQVGNALTNAATLLAAGKTVGTLEEVAVMVLETGERLKVRLTNGEFTPQ